MIRFLVVDAAQSAIPYADERGWTRIGAARYVTPERDDVRVVERAMELFFTPGGIILEKGPGYDEMLTSPDETPMAAERRERAETFERMVSHGSARWIDD